MDFKPSTKTVTSGVEVKSELSSVVPSVSPPQPKKFIILMFRKYTDLEWETFEKWGLRVYEYTSTSAAGQSLHQLLEKYDVVLIDMIKDESFQFYSLSQGDPLVKAHVCSLVGKRRRSNCDCERYGIMSQLKRFLEVTNADEFIRYLLMGNPKKPSSETVDAAKKIVEGLFGICVPLGKRLF